MATIRFAAEKKSNGYLIYVYISHQGKAIKRSMGFNIQKLSQWDSKKQEVKSHPDSFWMNGQIHSYSGNFAKYKDKVKRGEINFEHDEAYEVMRGKTFKDRTTLLSVAEAFIESHCKAVAAQTKTKYETMIRDIEGYEKHTRRKVRLSDVSKDFYRDYGTFLITHNPKTHKKSGKALESNSNNTVNRKIGRIITVMGWAFENGYVDSQKYLVRHSFKSSESGRFPLSLSELEKLWAFETSDKFERLVLDAFLFSTETGIRISDVNQLRPQQIVSITVENQIVKIIDFTQVKGTKKNQIPLSGRALSILSRQDQTKGNYFEINHGQSANRVLRRIAKHCGLTRMIELVKTKGSDTFREMVPLHDILSFHFARNTYITHLFAAGVNPAYVQANAGHSNLATTMKYNKEFTVDRIAQTLKVMDK